MNTPRKRASLAFARGPRGKAHGARARRTRGWNAAALLVAAGFGFPVYWMLITAFKTSADLNRVVPQFWPTHPTWSSFAEVLDDPIFRDDLRNSLVITVAAVLVSMVVGFFGALAIARFRFLGRRIFVVAVLAVQMIPLMALTIPMSLMLDGYGLKNTLPGVSLAYLMFTTPYTVWTLRTFIANIPPELDDAAMVDGCSRFQTFRHIILPLAAPGLIATGVFGWILAWNEFVLANTLLIDNSRQTAMVYLLGFQASPVHGADFGGLMAAATLTSLPVVVLFVIFQSRIATGLTSGCGEGMTVLTGPRVVTPGGILDDGWVEVEDGRILTVGSGSVPGDAVRLGSGWLVPGFVDLHVHGGGGHDVTGSADELRAAVAFHRRHGTTRTLVSLVTAPVDALCEQLGRVADLTEAGEVVGAHLEGPFLAASRCGAQNADHLLAPNPAVLQELLDAGRGCVRTVTLAPELPGGLDLVTLLVDQDVVAAVGHTDASYEEARAGFAAGASLATHLFNAMAPVGQRAPGPVIAALDSEAVVELINDGVHVHPALTGLVARMAPERVALVTDAISACGMPDGRYRLGGLDVEVRGGQARLAGAGNLAGSTLTMAEAFRRAVVEVGLGIDTVVRATATVPARVLGLEKTCGAIAEGLDADLVLLDDDHVVTGVMAQGAWYVEPSR